MSLSPPPRAVLFDYGGTLVTFRRPEAALARAYTEIADRLVALGSSRYSADHLVARVHDRVEAAATAHQGSGALEEIDLVAVAKDAYRDLGVELGAAELDELLAIEQQAWWDGIEVDPEAVPMLTALRTAGVRVGLCSNAPYRHRSLLAQLDHLGLSGCFDALTFSGAVRWRKPSPRIFAAALADIRSEAANTVMVGDSVREDIAGAHAAGMRTVLLVRNGSTTAVTSLADRTVSSLHEVIAVILG